MRSVNLGTSLIATLTLSACLHPARPVTKVDDAVWSATLGSAARTPYIDEHVPADPSIQWQERFGRGYTDMPAVQGELVIASSTAKTVTVANVRTGRRYWERRLNGMIAGALIRYNDRLYAATQSRDGRVEALLVSRGSHAWTVKMHAPAVGGALLVDSTLFVGSERADLFALHIGGGQQLWRVRLPAPLVATPVAWGSDLFLLTVRDSLLRVEQSTGRQQPGIRIAGSSSAPMALQGDRLLLPVHPGMLQAIHLPDMRLEWAAAVGAPILAAPALDTNGDVYVLTRTAEVWSIDDNGKATRIAALGGAAASSMTLTTDGLLIGTLDGVAHMLRRDGTVLWTRSFTHSIRSPIAVSEGSLFVPLGNGGLVMLK
ncbi:MAG: PQQ-binding-like beta-propeller repeat protein [Longimicrobiales bacterium]